MKRDKRVNVSAFQLRGLDFMVLSAPIAAAPTSALTKAEREVVALAVDGLTKRPEPTVDALADAAKRGVDVKLVLPGTSDQPMAFNAGRSYYTELLKAGVRIYERRGGVLHAKTAVIDGVWSTVGSTNMDMWSFGSNNELNAVVLGADFASEMEAMFQDDLANSDEVSLEKWKERPFTNKVRDWFYRLMKPWL